MAVLLDYKCPSCGGALSFDSDVQKLKCPYCSTMLEVAALQELDEAMKQEQPENTTWQQEPAAQWSEEEQSGLHSFVCESCGGEITTEATTAATHCPYCDNPVVVSERVTGELRPDLVVPFQLSREDAVQTLSNHLKGKVLLPKSFLTENRVEKLQGIYVPFWLFDADVNASMRYRATRVHHWSDNQYDYVRTSYYSLIRRGKLSFRHVPVDGSRKMADELMESLEPFDTANAVDFQTAYLAGFLADKFDLDPEACKQRANERIRTSTQQTFAQTVSGYTTVMPEHSSINLEGSAVRYALLPVWLLTTRYRDKVYTFAMNGQTGKMVGNLPIHLGKFYGMLAGIWLAAGSFFTLIAWLLERL